MRFALLAAAAAATSALAVASAQPQAPVVQTTAGPIVGITTTTGYAYLGVPFAAPPQRWGPPVPPTPWTAPLNASTFRAGCIEFLPGPREGPGGKLAPHWRTGVDDIEDCLTVNVFVPLVRSEGNPLIVWTHGGGFIGGNGAGDFSSYANGTGAVIVSLNYRLGATGYMALPGMAPAFPTPTDPSVAVANVGLLDQQLALNWTRANAAAFGADPGNVLITGQSAGGSSVLFQLTLPGGYGAYKAAVPMSPGSPVNPLGAAQATASAIAAALNCPTSLGYSAQLACLRAAPIDQVVSASVAVAHTSFLPLTLGPVNDGALVHAAPADAILAGDFNRNARILVTETAFEGDSLLTGYAHAVTLNASQAADSIAEFGRMVGLNASETATLGGLYDGIAQRDGLYNASTRMWGDGLLACVTSWAAEGFSRFSSYPVYRFLWNTTLQQQCGNSQPACRPTHGTDLAFFFNPPSYFTPPEAAIQEDLYGWLTNLAVTGDPNSGPGGAGPLVFPPYVPGTTTVLAVTEQRQYSFVESWQEEFCPTWLAIVP
jgi:para-nitrobenzyl esterase